jgi:hypothetical protein
LFRRGASAAPRTLAGKDDFMHFVFGEPACCSWFVDEKPVDENALARRSRWLLGVTGGYQNKVGKVG